MKPVTLVTTRLYFGVDALRMRDAAARVLTRVQGLPSHRRTVRLEMLLEDFHVGAAASRAMVDEMVQSGLLQRVNLSGGEYLVTDTFRQYAEARIVEPLPRARAQLLLAQIGGVAKQFNRTASSNKYEIAAVAVFGSYMSLDPDVKEISLGVTGRLRAQRERPADGVEAKPAEGHEQIRKLFQAQSGFVRVSFFKDLPDVPRPFSVIFKDQV